MDDYDKLNQRINETNKNFNEWLRLFTKKINNLEKNVAWLRSKKNLSPNELQVYNGLLLGKKQVEIARKLNLTKGRISQITKQIKAKDLLRFR